ncbi:cobalamin-binding protein [Alteribacter populi]|uniref:cobalamin-binding protein n=1 Tax=Alteribacter populi TaxID=2011011 RepID=UPI000BBA6B64|nr:cobalamin-binding protein [Alteribacter populi]
MRLISICPSNTEFIAYLGLTSHLVGVDDFSDWPEEIQSLPRLGPDLNIDMDKVEALKPDLVLASLSVPGMERNVEELERRGIPYYTVPNPKKLNEVGDVLQLIGEKTNTTVRAEQVYKRFQEIMTTYNEISATITKPKTIYWEWWPKPVFTPGKENWLTEMSELAGGNNVFADQPVASVKTDWEDVKNRNPDVISVVWVGVQKEKVQPKVILKRPGWQEITAIQEDQLFVLEEPFFCRPSPRLLIGLAKIASILHPDKYPQFDEQDPLLIMDRPSNN